MIQYKVRTIETGGTGELEDACNAMAADGWRLVSTSVVDLSALGTRTYLFFERETGQQEPQDAWRTQHGGQDAG